VLNLTKYISRKESVIMPDVLSLARFQFAMTTVFHFFFVPLSIGLGVCVSVMETRYCMTGDVRYKQLTKFWGKMLILSFAVGVVTGIIQEFQFGMNWSDYSRFVGDIFGAPLAIEALLSFFLESTFLGVWMFSWEKVSKKTHCLFIWLVTIGSTLSALWILTANSFMQHPEGFEIINGRAQMVDFGAVISNPQVWYEFGHVIFAALTLAAFFIMGSSAINIIKKKEVDFYKKSMKTVAIIAIIGAMGTAGVGDLQARALVKDQPLKFAAMEGIYKDTPDPAPWAVLSNINTEKRESEPIIEVPYLLSILSYHKLSGSVRGMDSVTKEFQSKYGDLDYNLPVKTMFYSFRVMAGFGGIFVLMSIIALIGIKKNKIENWKVFLKLMGICTFLPWFATSTGWLITELGRYPWTVYGLFTIADSVSPNVTAGQLLFTNIVYFGLFTILGGVMVYLMVRQFKKGPFADENNLTAENVDPFGYKGV